MRESNSQTTTSAPLQILVQSTESDEGQHVRKANTNDARKAESHRSPSQEARGQEYRKSVHYSPHQNGWRRLNHCVAQSQWIVHLRMALDPRMVMHRRMAADQRKGM